MSPANQQIAASPQAPPAKRCFTPAEADRAVVLVRRIVADAVAEYARLLDLHEAVEAAERAKAWPRWEDARMGLIRSAGKLRGYIQELQEVGVELRDWSLGVVDFPSLLGTRPVWLCWRLGDERVAWWHPQDDCAARRPVEELADQHALARRWRRTPGAPRKNAR